MTATTESTPLRCRQVARVLQRYLDGEVDAETAHRVSAHLERCEDCGLEAEAYRAILDTLAARRRLPPDLGERVRRFAADLAAHGPGDHEPHQGRADPEAADPERPDPD